jgi:serine protease SohB
MENLFVDYGLFLAKLLTGLILAVAALVLVLTVSRRGGAPQEELKVERLNDKLEQLSNRLRSAVESKEAFKKRLKAQKKAHKQADKAADSDATRRMFVLDFKGDIRASATTSLRNEISAIIATASAQDKVVLRLENPGGTVHEHGLAASQLIRLKDRDIELVVVVDKVAASGGYLMACVANQIIAAPFAIVGSIGVLAQLPNFNRLLKEKGIDFEQIAAGRYKRTLTVFGENTAEGREKLRDELEEVHALFKEQISRHRPQVDLNTVATGEHWYGSQALALKLVDELGTSDDYLMAALDDYQIFHVSFQRKRTLPERIFGGAASLLAGY